MFVFYFWVIGWIKNGIENELVNWFGWKTQKIFRFNFFYYEISLLETIVNDFITFWSWFCISAVSCKLKKMIFCQKNLYTRCIEVLIHSHAWWVFGVMIGKQHSVSSSYLKSCQSLVMRLTRRRRYYLKYPHILNMSSSYKIYSCHIVKYHKFSMFYSPYKMPSCYICRI